MDLQGINVLQHVYISLIPALVGIVVGGGLGSICGYLLGRVFASAPGSRKRLVLLPRRTLVVFFLLVASARLTINLGPYSALSTALSASSRRGGTFGPSEQSVPPDEQSQLLGQPGAGAPAQLWTDRQQRLLQTARFACARRDVGQPLEGDTPLARSPVAEEAAHPGAEDHTNPVPGQVRKGAEVAAVDPLRATAASRTEVVTLPDPTSGCSVRRHRGTRISSTAARTTTPPA